MPLENRNLEAGTRLAARYKGTTYTCEVVQTEEGIRYRLEDGREFKSPSSAASAVMGGMAANGWRFWSLADSISEKPEKPKKSAKPKKGTAGKAEAVECGETFPSAAEATEHLVTAHTQAQPET